jgi:hypothetical protein
MNQLEKSQFIKIICFLAHKATKIQAQLPTIGGMDAAAQ